MEFTISLYILPIAIIALIWVAIGIVRLLSHQGAFVLYIPATGITMILLAIQVILFIVWVLKNIHINITT